ncbi:unnamed protein product [Symbiodinium natans]|uniref:Uncharacterized protein n=1 Tax=Symbiodinium natans TaxID=878477 RepID=A0A812V5E5_9DINO|nr:unnamed protein product [Symbiodinium natans]
MARRSRRLWLGALAAALSLKCAMHDEAVNQAEAMVFRPWRPRASDLPDSTTLPAVTTTLLVGVLIGVGAFQDYPAMPQLFESVKDETWTKPAGSRQNRLPERCARYRSISLDADRRPRDRCDAHRSRSCRHSIP